MLRSPLLGPRSSVSQRVLGVPCHEIRDTPGPASPHVYIPLFCSLLAVYGLAPQALPQPGCRATLAGHRQRLWQGSAASVCRDPKPNGCTPAPPPAGVGEAKPSPNAPARPVLRGRGAHFLREQRWDRTLHTPQRPPCEREDPHRTPRLGPSAAAAGCGVPGRRRGEGERRLPFSPAQRARPPAGPGNEARARGNPSIREPGPPNSTAPARACGGFGEGGPARSRTVTQPQRNRRVGTCRPGGRGRRGPRYCPAPSGVRPVPAAHAPCARPRPSGRSLPAVSARS